MRETENNQSQGTPQVKAKKKRNGGNYRSTFRLSNCLLEVQSIEELASERQCLAHHPSLRLRFQVLDFVQ